MATPHTVGDTSPDITFTVNAVLTGTTLEVHIARPDGSVFAHPGTVVDGPGGRGSMALAPGDLNQSGTYRVEVQVTFAGGGVQTFAFDPTDQYNSFNVRDQIA